MTWPPAVEELEDDAYTELVERVMDEASTPDFDHLSPEALVDDILDNVPRAFIDAALEEVWRAEPSARERVLGSYEKDTIGGRLVLRGCLRDYLIRYAQLIRAFPDSDEREKDGRLVRRRATRDAYSIFTLARKWGAERGDAEPQTIGDYIAALLRDDQRTWYFGPDARIPALRDEEDCWVLANVLGRYAAAGRTGSDNPQP